MNKIVIFSHLDDTRLQYNLTQCLFEVDSEILGINRKDPDRCKAPSGDLPHTNHAV